VVNRARVSELVMAVAMMADVEEVRLEIMRGVEVVSNLAAAGLYRGENSFK